MSKFLSVSGDRVAYTRLVIARVFLMGCFLNFFSFDASAQAELIKDIDQREEVLSNEYNRITSGTSRVFFVSGVSLWKTDGTPETTTKLKTFNGIDKIVMAGNTAYFSANDGSGMELWKSNGTPSGTIRVKDIYPGTSGSNPQSITNVGALIYFTAENGKNGRELWKSNGTAAGTVMVKDILRVTGSSSPSGLTNINGILYFAANNGSEGIELWKSDGTTEGTVMVKDIRPGSKISSAPQFLTRSNGTLFFSAIDEQGRELWKSDGTPAGTVRVKDIRLGGNSDIENLIDVNGTLFFTATDGVHGDELWKSDGTETGTLLVKDMNPGSAGSNSEINFTRPGDMNNFRNINGMLFFIASTGVEDYIYRSDGTSAGTIRIMNAVGTGLNLPQPYFTYLDGHVYFFNVDGVDDDHPQRGPMYLWKMPVNGTTPVRVREFHTPYSYSDEFYYENYDHAMVQCNGALYIVGRLESHLGFKLIRSDGTAAGTKIVTDTSVSTLGSNPRDFVAVNGVVFFRTFPDPYNYAWPSEGDYYSEDLYRTDGTAAGTIRMPGGFHEWNEMEPVGNSLYYTVENGGWELNKTDGTNITSVTMGSTGEDRPTILTAVGNTLYYTNAYAQLWKTDGTIQGTVMMKDFFSIKSITDVEGKAFILAETSAGGLELWRTNASGAVVRIKTIRTNAATQSTYNPTATRGHIMYFVANDGIHGNEIWETDGTSSGTFMLRDLNPHDPNAAYSNNEGDIRSMVFTNGSLIINAMDQELLWAIHTYSPSSKLWKTTRVGDEAASPLIAVNNKAFFVSHTQLMATDGSGTLVQLTDIGAHEQVAYAVIGNHLYVSSAPYNHGLWRTNGTECGTIKIQTGVGSAFQLAAIGNHLIMGGSEPYIYRNIESLDTPCDAIVFSASQETELIMTPYPNPFTNNFTLRVHGAENEEAEVAVFSDSGMPIEKLGAVKANVDHPNIGGTWPNGIYYVKVSKGGKLTTHTVVKR